MEENKNIIMNTNEKKSKNKVKKEQEKKEEQDEQVQEEDQTEKQVHVHWWIKEDSEKKRRGTSERKRICKTKIESHWSNNIFSCSVIIYIEYYSAI